MIANTLRLELVDLLSCPPAVAAFLGALTAGLLSSLIQKPLGYPRISITVPSIVIMVPGLYLYRAVYNLGEMSLGDSASWLASALLIVLALPLGWYLPGSLLTVLSATVLKAHPQRRPGREIL